MQNIQCIVFDADGVLFDEENPYLAIASKLGIDEKVREWVQEYLQNKVSYEELVDREIEAFKSSYKKTYGKRPETGDLERLLPFPEVREGIDLLFKDIIRSNREIYVLSSGFMHLTRELTRLKVKQDHIHSNRFLYDTNGEFVTMLIDVHADKLKAFDQIVHSSKFTCAQFAYVGDNAFDEIVMRHALEEGASVYLLEEAVKEFKLTTLPVSDRFHKIAHVEELRRAFDLYFQHS